jgi:hypothetical protein
VNYINNNQKTMPIILTSRRGRIFLKMICLSLGNDFVITLSGGDLEHIGAVVVSKPNSSNIHKDAVNNIMMDVIIVPEHKEDCLAKSVASLLATNLNNVVCVVCGIHLEHILKTELKDIIEMSEEMTKSLIAQVTMR